MFILYTCHLCFCFLGILPNKVSGTSPSQQTIDLECPPEYFPRLQLYNYFDEVSLMLEKKSLILESSHSSSSSCFFFSFLGLLHFSFLLVLTFANLFFLLNFSLSDISVCLSVFFLGPSKLSPVKYQSEK